MAVVSMKQLLEAGVHFGHMTISAVIMSLFLESPIRRQLLHRISEKEGKEQTGV